MIVGVVVLPSFSLHRRGDDNVCGGSPLNEFVGFIFCLFYGVQFHVGEITQERRML